MKSLKQVLPNETVDEDLGLFVKDIFPKYFELQSKDREQLSAIEMTTLSSILEYFKCIKIDLAEKYGISLDTTQIIFVAPPLADWDTDVLRALFLEAGWITTEEDESKLMLVPFIEAHVNYLQTSGTHKEKFQREEKYMLLFMQLTEEGDKVIYTSVCFQMQCAKELIAVSKKLACSDFLLVPSILSTKSICLSAIDNTLQSAIERIIANSRNNHKMQHGVESRDVGIPPTGKNLFSAIKGTAAKVKNNFEIRYGVKSEDSKIAASLTKILFNTKHSFASELTIGSFLPDVNFEKYQLLDFKDYTGVHLLTGLTHDPSIQQHTRTVCNFLQESMSEYGTISNSPDGVRRVILSYDGQKFEKGPHCICIEKALFKANIIKPQVKFSQVFGQVFLNQTGALQRSLKINQIANTLLPALILNEEKSNTATSSERLENDSIVLPLNSFYLEAHIGKQQVNFILNKVVKASTTKTHAELFTAEERAIDIDDIRTATSGILWRHYQLLESEGHLGELISC
ncbi:hypothetical protein MAM1_0197d07789 [Mucor ambiguus]|uniref:Uncharacterized protein n=1 Tax=Mucor ambiguus TaxID=91626 RepID=A0A0C9LWC4_9FUNG|nr:hypothetical protein MAM1_0197d07789 [Mucor ambiguus]